MSCSSGWAWATRKDCAWRSVSPAAGRQKIRFVSAVTTGLASAFLLALGAGIVAMMRQGPK
jgi:hypothetical protein